MSKAPTIPAVCQKSANPHFTRFNVRKLHFTIGPIALNKVVAIKVRRQVLFQIYGLITSDCNGVKLLKLMNSN